VASGGPASYGARIARNVLAVLAVALLSAGIAHEAIGEGGGEREVARVVALQSLLVADGLETTLSASGELTGTTRAYLSWAAQRLDASLVLFFEADTPIATAHGPSLRRALPHLDRSGGGERVDSGPTPWVPRFDDTLDPKALGLETDRPLRLQLRYPFAAEVPIRDDLSLRFVPLAVRPLAAASFRSALFVIGLVSALMAIWASLRLARPVERAAAAMERLATDPSGPRLPGDSTRELEWLARSASRLAERADGALRVRERMLRAVGGRIAEPARRAADALATVDAAALATPSREALQRAGDAVEVVRKLGDQLAHWRQLEAGGASLAVRPADLRALVQDVTAAWVAKRAPDIDLRVSVDPALEREVPLDARLVAGVLASLLENARLHGAPPIDVVVRRANTKVEIDVRDHGPGVPAERIPGLFEPFGRAVGEEAQSAAQGLGLGLRIAQLVLQQHEGGLLARNHPQGGFEVAFWIPARPTRMREPDRGFETPPPSSARLLAVPPTSAQTPAPATARTPLAAQPPAAETPPPGAAREAAVDPAASAASAPARPKTTPKSKSPARKPPPPRAADPMLDGFDPTPMRSTPPTPVVATVELPPKGASDTDPWEP
jgi:signal transduction histidine kinase